MQNQLMLRPCKKNAFRTKRIKTSVGLYKQKEVTKRSYTVTDDVTGEIAEMVYISLLVLPSKLRYRPSTADLYLHVALILYSLLKLYEIR